MANCPNCGEPARMESVSKDGIILVCPNNHRFEKKLTPKQKLAEMSKCIRETPDDLTKRNYRLRKRRNNNNE